MKAKIQEIKQKWNIFIQKTWNVTKILLIVWACVSQILLVLLLKGWKVQNPLVPPLISAVVEK